MRLYPRTDTTAIDHPEYGHIKAGKDGGFDFPEDLAEELHRFHVGKEPAWETQVERQARLAAEEEARMRDPATLAALVADLVRAQAPFETAPARVPAKRAAAGKPAASA